MEEREEKQIKKLVLIASINEKLIKDMEVVLQDNYEIAEANSKDEALKAIIANLNSFVALFLDNSIIKMDSFQIISLIRQKKIMSYIPIIAVLDNPDTALEESMYNAGVTTVITRPFNKAILDLRIDDIVRVHTDRKNLALRAVQQNNELNLQADRLRALNENIMDMLGSIVQFRSSANMYHVKRIKLITRLLAVSLMKVFPEYGLEKQDVESIVAASCIHDVGKILIPDSILLKPSKLTADEFDIMKSHTTKGCEIVSAMSEYQNSLFNKYAYEITRYHHEKYDGKGYPEKLSGDKIPISAQIVSISDAFDALISDSVFREKIEFEKSFDMIIDGDCGVFNPDIIQCFRANKKRIKEIADKYTGDDESL